MCSFFDTIVLTKRTNIIWLYQPKLFCILWYLNTATFLSAKSSLAILLWPLTSTFRPALSEIVKLILNNSWKSLKSSSFSILMLRTHLNFSSLALTLSTYLKMLTCCHVISCWDRRIKKQLNTWLSECATFRLIVGQRHGKVNIFQWKLICFWNKDSNLFYRHNEQHLVYHCVAFACCISFILALNWRILLGVSFYKKKLLFFLHILISLPSTHHLFLHSWRHAILSCYPAVLLPFVCSYTLQLKG